MGLFRSLFVGSSFMLNNPANCWMSSSLVYSMPFGLMLTIDLRFTSLMIILLFFMVLSFGLLMVLADMALLKNVFFVFELECWEVFEQ